MMHRKKAIFIGVLCTIITIAAIYIFYYKDLHGSNYIHYNMFMKDVNEGRVDKVYIFDSDKIRSIYKDGNTFITDNPRKNTFKEELLLMGIKVEEKDNRLQIARGIIILALAGIVIALIKTKDGSTRFQTQRDADKFSSISTDEVDNMDIVFEDIAGNEEAKDSIKDIVDFINNPKKYSNYGARLPRGVIFYGPPGTGKTLMAKAVAGEAGVPFYALSGSDFVQLYVGVGASRIRDLFKKARQKGKCVIFIDEIDALGKKRNSSIDSGGNDERDQTLNALLAEMSGFNKNEGIVVIAATNRLDILDDALLRPGRFDRHIEIGLPDINARYEILKLHCLNKPLAEDVDLYNLAEQTVYFSGAKLENMINEAAIFAAKRDKGSIENDDIERALYTIIAGEEKKDRSSISSRDRKITAYHEGGHALVTKLVAPENRVTKVTIIPSTKGVGGFSMNIGPDSMYYKKSDMENNIKIALGGRAAEEIVFGSENITTGAANDIEKATNIILNMIKTFGMDSSMGLINYDILHQSGIDGASEEIVEKCKVSLQEIYDQVKKILKENRTVLDKIANTLLEKETIYEDELDSLIKNHRVCA
ncbi:MAG: ATP-dependent zinc metalloprotease FtsH [Clostridiales bacterium]|mgnify:CR=1 FL=1|nr:ATP-dependent zinc metalloprotease FtsH [Clostridiales bacterium]